MNYLVKIEIEAYDGFPLGEPEDVLGYRFCINQKPILASGGEAFEIEMKIASKKLLEWLDPIGELLRQI
jgi:hypothetical protein